MGQKILYITTLLPYPPDMGGKIKTLLTLKNLVKENDVYLFAFVDKDDDLYFQKELLKLGIKRCFVIVSPLIAEKHRITQIKILLESFFTIKPYSVYKYYTRDMVLLVNKFLANNKIDKIWIDHTIQTQYLPKNFGGEKILETHNFKTDFFWQMFLQEKKWFWKIFSFYEYLKFIIYEPKELKKFDLVYAISKQDKKNLIRYNKNVQVLFPEINKTENKGKFESKKLFFVGLLTWYPNKQGISWFCNDVFPQLRKDIPDLTLDIIGDYSKRWQLPVYPGVRFHGYVKDIKKYWQNASVFIVPLRYGSGIRIKILEALANGIPVVSTSIGARGLSDKIKEKVIIADDKSGFVENIIKLLKDNNFYLQHN